MPDSPHDLAGSRTAQACMSLCLQANVPCTVQGAPGVGKTAFTRAMSVALGLPVVELNPSMREPSDFMGLPIQTNGHVVYAPPAWALNLAENGTGLLFIDEANTGSEAVQAACMRIMLDGVVGEFQLPPDVRRIMVTNPVDIAPNASEFSAPMANRLCHLKWEVDVTAWITGTLQGWLEPEVKVLPDDWKNGIPTWAAVIAGYIQANPGQLLQLPTTEQDRAVGWPSPRSWTMCYRLLAAADAAGYEHTSAVTTALVYGCIGQAAGISFMAWLKNQDLPDPEDLLARPGSFVMPSRNDQVYVILSSVVGAVVGNLTKARWDAAWTIITKASKAGRKDAAMTAAMTLSKANNQNLQAPREAVDLVDVARKAKIIKAPSK